MAVPWSSWASLGKAPESDLRRPLVHRNQDGRLEVFAVARGIQFNIWQIHPNAGWHEGWSSLGSPSSDVAVAAHVVGRNADGRLEVFAVGDDEALWQKWQVAPNDGWSEWKTLGRPAHETPLTVRLTAGKNQDGRQEVFVLGRDGNVRQIWQTSPNGGWSAWGSLGHPPAAVRSHDRITVGRNEDGRQELFVLGGDDALWHIWQVAPNVGWSSWESLGKPRDSEFPEPRDRDLSEPFVQENPDGHLEVFAPGNGAFCNRWQEAPNGSAWRRQGWNEKPRPTPEVGIEWLTAAIDARRHRVEVLALGDDGALWHAWQIFEAPFWSPWESLNAPPAGIRPEEQLTVAANQDRRLEVFLVGQDDAVWHIWQTH